MVEKVKGTRKICRESAKHQRRRGAYKKGVHLKEGKTMPGMWGRRVTQNHHDKRAAIVNLRYMEKGKDY